MFELLKCLDSISTGTVAAVCPCFEWLRQLMVEVQQDVLCSTQSELAIELYQSGARIHAARVAVRVRQLRQLWAEIRSMARTAIGRSLNPLLMNKPLVLQPPEHSINAAVLNDELGRGQAVVRQHAHVP